MNEIGRVCMKIAGRDAGKMAIIIDQLEEGYVLIDGQTRRKKVNVKHIEPIDRVLKIEKNASSAIVKKTLATIDVVVTDKKPKKITEKPVKQRKQHQKPVVEKAKKSEIKTKSEDKVKVKSEEKVEDKKETKVEAEKKSENKSNVIDK